MMSRLHCVAFTILFCLLAATGMAQTAPLEDLASFPRAKLEIRSGKTLHRFDVWVADSPSRQAQGLMFVRDLPAERGMLFVHREPRVANMWMKNTYIPLDMLFIDPAGRIVKIAERTTPHSLDTISSVVPVGAVLEIKGGEANRLGLRVGDVVVQKPPSKD